MKLTEILGMSYHEVKDRFEQEEAEKAYETIVGKPTERNPKASADEPEQVKSLLSDVTASKIVEIMLDSLVDPMKKKTLPYKWKNKEIDIRAMSDTRALVNHLAYWLDCEFKHRIAKLKGLRFGFMSSCVAIAPKGGGQLDCPES